MDRRFWFGLAAYVLPTFPLGYFWHLTIFASQHHALQVYRPDIIIPFGLLSMLIQGSLLSWVYPKVMRANTDSSWLADGLKFGLAAGAFAWSFTTLAVAAKHVMTSVPLYVVLETGFTIAQYIVVGPLLALAWRR